MPVLHSTKNLHVIEPPTATATGIGVFEYTDHYSVFHYGRMPDAIPGKGEATCRMAAFNFALLAEAGVPTHFRRFIPPNRIEFDLARIPEHEPSPATPEGGSRLVPVQVLYRNELPQGSSVHRRLAAGTFPSTTAELSTAVSAGTTLAQPLLEYATMLEPVNRYLNRDEAQHLSAVDADQFATMTDLAITVNDVLSHHAREVGLTHCDGKIEYLVDGDGRIVVADSPGTPDECRLMFDGVHCGKQVLRNWYVAHHLDMPVDRYIADGVPRHAWPQPARLPAAFLPVMSDLYQSLSATWTGQTSTKAPDLSTAVQAVAALIR
jgi:phosphoribosylaminoimidazole-succinocarboxamide synthase